MKTISSIVTWVMCVFLITAGMLTREVVPDLVLAQGDKPRIAILPLEANNIPEGDAKGLTDRLRTELFRIHAFEVLERTKMETILDEQRFVLSGCVSDMCLIEVGQMLAVRLMVGGSVTRIGDTYSVDVRMMDVETGKVVKIASEDYKGKIDSVMTEVMRRIARQLAGLPPEARQRAFYRRRWFWLVTTALVSGSIAVVRISQQGQAHKPATGVISINEAWSDWDE